LRAAHDEPRRAPDSATVAMLTLTLAASDQHLRRSRREFAKDRALANLNMEALRSYIMMATSTSSAMVATIVVAPRRRTARMTLAALRSSRCAVARRAEGPSRTQQIRPQQPATLPRREALRPSPRTRSRLTSRSSSSSASRSRRRRSPLPSARRRVPWCRNIGSCASHAHVRATTRREAREARRIHEHSPCASPPTRRTRRSVDFPTPTALERHDRSWFNHLLSARSDCGSRPSTPTRTSHSSIAEARWVRSPWRSSLAHLEQIQ